MTSFKVSHDEDGDLTANYDITLTADSTLTINKREATVKVELEKPYDKLPTSSGTATDVSADKILGGLLEGDVAFVYVVTENGEIDASETPYRVIYVSEGTQFTVFNGSEDITANYVITLSTDSTLKINKRKATVKVELEKTYDKLPTSSGTATDVSTDMTYGGLLDGDVAYIYVTTENGEVNAAEIPYKVIFVSSGTQFNVKNGDEDLSRNYDLSVSLDSTLKINKRTATVKAELEKPYDKTTLGEGDSVEVLGLGGGLLAGDVVHVYVTTGGEINASTTPYLVTMTSFKVSHDEDGDLTANYDITLTADSTLTINKREATVKVELEKIYDRTDVAEGYATDISTDKELGGILLGDKVYVYVTTSGNVNFSETPYFVTMTSFKVSNDADGDITANYDITLSLDSTLKINKRVMSITTDGWDWVYDGEAHSYEKFTPQTDDGVKEEGLLEDEKITAENWPTVTTVPGEIDNIPTFKITYNGEDITFNYDFEDYITAGKLTVSKRKVEITTNSHQWVYDGKEHSDTGFVHQTDDGIKEEGILAGHSLVLKEGASSYTTVKDVTNGHYNKLTLVVMCGDEDVSSNYDLTTNLSLGTLSVTKRVLGITVSLEKPYDMSASFDSVDLRNEKLTATSQRITLNAGALAENNLSDMHSIQLILTATSPNAGTWSATVSDVVIFDEYGEEATDNYNITGILGILTIKPNGKLVVVTNSAAKKFDGTPLTCEIFRAELTDGFMPEDSVVKLVFTGSQTEVGKSLNTAIVTVIDKNGENTVGNYAEVLIKCGTLEVFGTQEETDLKNDEPQKIGGGGAIGGKMPSGDALCYLVRSERDGKLYLKYKSFGSYSGESWDVDVEEYKYLIDDKYSASYLTALALGTTMSGFNVEIIALNGQYLVPYYPGAGFLQMGEIQTSDIVVSGNADEMYEIYCYLSESFNGAELPDKYKTYESLYREFVYDNYLKIDSETLEFMQAIIAEQGFSKSNPTLITDVARFIQESATYDLNYNKDLDYEDNIAVAFLSKYKSGICQHYATAATLLFRAMGVPARYTVGFTADALAGEFVDVTAASAHAWVEVYLDGIGWVVVEVTGGAEGGFNGEFSNWDSESKPPQVDTRPEIVIFPKRTTVIYDGKPHEISTIVIDKLLQNLVYEGYKYDFKLEGEAITRGRATYTITEFILYDPDGNVVTDEFNVKKKTNELEIVDVIVEVALLPVVGTYGDVGGAAITVHDNDKYYVLTEGYRVEFSKLEIRRETAGTIEFSEINENRKKYASFKIYKGAIDITDGATIEFVQDPSIEESYDPVTLKKREITVKTHDYENVYNGENHVDTRFEITSGSTAFDQVAKLDEDELITSSVNVTVGKNEFKVKIFDGEDDVSKNYVIKYDYGNFIVNKRKVTIASESKEWVYDATSHKQEKFTVQEQSGDRGIISGHLAVLISAPEITNVGKKDNILTVKIMNGDVDVSKNYDIDTQTNAGTIEITPRPVKLVPEKRSRMYDGTANVSNAIESSGLPDGHRVRQDAVVKTIPDGNVGIKTVTVKLDSIIIEYMNDEGEWVEADLNNFEISLEDGTLEITKRTILIIGASGEKYYDGKPLTVNKYELFAGFHENFPEIEFFELVSGDKLAVSLVGSQTERGESANMVVVDDITTSKGVSVKDNYDIYTIDGTLTVSGTSITIAPAYSEKIYDADTLFPNAEINFISGELLPGHHIESVIHSESVNVTPEGEYCILYIEEFAIYDEDGNPVPDGLYLVNIENGKGVITKRKIYVQTESESWMYDGKTHKNTSYIVEPYNEETGRGLIPGHTDKFVNSTTINDVGSVLNIVEIKIVQGDENVTDNYEIDYESQAGYLEVTPREITIVPEYSEKIYDGTVTFVPFTPNVVISENSPNGLAASGGGAYEHMIFATVKNSSASADTHETVIEWFEIRYYDSDSGEWLPVNKENYIVTVETGIMTIHKRPLLIIAESDEKVYDGTVLTSPGYTIYEGEHPDYEGIEFLPLCDGHGLNASVNGEILLPGEISCSVKVRGISAGTSNVMRNYDIKTIDGTLKVTGVPITLEPVYQEKLYDGDVIYIEGEYELIKFIEGELVLGDYIYSVTVVTDVADVVTDGKPHQLRIESIKILNAYGVDVTSGYEITAKYGSAVITPRELKVTTPSAEKKYDGTPLVDNNYDVEWKHSIADGHSIIVEVTGSITEVGSIENSVSVKLINQYGEDATENYKITYELGTLTVMPGATITVVTDGAIKEYDGYPLTSPDYEIFVTDGELADGHEVVVVILGSQTEVGESKNVAVVKVIDRNGKDVGQYYAGLNVIEGTLKVTDDGSGYAGGIDYSDKIGANGIIGAGNMPDGADICYLVRSEKDGRLYLKFKSFGSYMGDSWTEAEGYSVMIYGSNYTYSAAYLTAIALAAKAEGFNVDIVALNGQYLLPYYAGASDEYREVLQKSDVVISGNADELSSLFCYSLDNIDGASLPASLTNYEIYYRNFVYDNYLKIDNYTLNYMNKIIEAQGFDKNDKDVIAKVAAFIMASAAYDLDYDRGLDAEDNIAVAFLEEYKSGICQHYATAATLLFRAMGIPARYTVGFVADAKAGEFVGVSTAEAHAWVEVYLDGIGWVAVEVTGGSNEFDGSFDNWGDNEIPDSATDSSMQITVSPEYTSYLFDGELHKAQNAISVSYELGLLLAKGYRYEVQVTGERTSVGRTTTYIKKFVLYNSAGQDVTSKFNIVLNTGILEIASSFIDVELLTVSAAYGTEGGASIGIEDENILFRVNANGMTLVFEKLDIRLEKVGYLTFSDINNSLDKYVKYKVYMGSEDVTDSVKLRFVPFSKAKEPYNPITVNPKKVSLSTATYNITYDGKSHELVECGLYDGVYYEGAKVFATVYSQSMPFANGDLLLVTKSISAKSVNNYENKIEFIIVDVYGNDVTHYYDITIDFGKVSIYEKIS